MYEFYSKPLDPNAWKRAKDTLKSIYNDIPETEGCMENIAKEGGCGAWCCQSQNPSVFFSEFLLTWGRVSGNWTKAQKAELIIRCLRNYFDKTTSKGCVFWNSGTKLCQQHESRPYNCRVYGQTPEEDFKPRYEKLKVLYPDADIREQCSLVKSPAPPTKEQINKWFNEIRFVEHDCGVHHTLHTDEPGGSYRSYHDHVLLQIGNAAFLQHVSKLRISGTIEQQEKFIVEFEKDLKRDLKL